MHLPFAINTMVEFRVAVDIGDYTRISNVRRQCRERETSATHNVHAHPVRNGYYHYMRLVLRKCSPALCPAAAHDWKIT